MIKDIGSENRQRLEVLYRNHYKWLVDSAVYITRNRTEADDLIGDLFVYLGEKENPKLWYADSFNLKYCQSFFKTRWLNKVKRDGKSISRIVEREDDPYDEVFDKRLEDAYDEIIKELERLKIEKHWSSARLFEIYWFGDKTMAEVSQEIGISNSTTFLNVRSIKQHLKQNCTNPFKDA